MPHPFTLTVPYTLSFMANIGRDAAFGTIKRGFMAEFDCSIEVEYTDPDDWEIVGIHFDKTKWADGFGVDSASDPDMWKLVERALEYDWKDLESKIIELMYEDYSDRRAAREDDAHDRWVESR